MAYVKIKPIHSNVQKALEYITNPDKTSNSTLVSSYGCSISPKVAKLEFELVNKKAIKKKERLRNSKASYPILFSRR